jgi:hypothetical protein
VFPTIRIANPPGIFFGGWALTADFFTPPATRIERQGTLPPVPIHW